MNPSPPQHTTKPTKTYFVSHFPTDPTVHLSQINLIQIPVLDTMINYVFCKRSLPLHSFRISLQSWPDSWISVMYWIYPIKYFFPSLTRKIYVLGLMLITQKPPAVLNTGLCINLLLGYPSRWSYNLTFLPDARPRKNGVYTAPSLLRIQSVIWTAAYGEDRNRNRTTDLPITSPTWSY